MACIYIKLPKDIQNLVDGNLHHDVFSTRVFKEELLTAVTDYHEKRIRANISKHCGIDITKYMDTFAKQYTAQKHLVVHFLHLDESLQCFPWYDGRRYGRNAVYDLFDDGFQYYISVVSELYYNGDFEAALSAHLQHGNMYWSIDVWYDALFNMSLDLSVI